MAPLLARDRRELRKSLLIARLQVFCVSHIAAFRAFMRAFRNW